MATKKRLELKPNDGQNSATLAAVGPGTAVTVTATAAGPVSTLDKVKGYYKALIGAVGAVLVVLNEITPATDFLPPDARHWVSVGIVTLTAISNALVKNQHWVDDL